MSQQSQRASFHPFPSIIVVLPHVAAATGLVFIEATSSRETRSVSRSSGLAVLRDVEKAQTPCASAHTRMATNDVHVPDSRKRLFRAGLHDEGDGLNMPFWSTGCFAMDVAALA